MARAERTVELTDAAAQLQEEVQAVLFRVLNANVGLAAQKRGWRDRTSLISTFDLAYSSYLPISINCMPTFVI